MRRCMSVHVTPAFVAGGARATPSRSCGSVGDRDDDLGGAALLRARGRPRSAIRARAGPRSCRPRSAGLSSRNPTIRMPGVSRASRAKLRPSRPAPTMSTRDASRSRPPAVPPFDEHPEGEPRAADEHRREDRVEDEHRRREADDEPRSETDDRPASDRRHRARDRDDELVGRRRVAPDAAVDPAEHEAEVAGSEHDRKRCEEGRALDVVPEPADDDVVGGEERAAHEREVDDDLDHPSRLEQRAPQ